ncbi:MAG: hypothetical protein OEW29_04875 [Acidimicrobiia bacterium]|nr:hypothetical protein [Acidimicrobiia bacterium]
MIASIRRPSLSGRSEAEAKLSHLWDLAARPDAASLGVDDLADAVALSDKAIVRRARDKVTGRVALEYRAMTPAMLVTPRSRLCRRARFSRWTGFPSNPDAFYERFRPTVERVGDVSKGASFSVVDRLVKRRRDLDGPRRTVPDRLALYRAFHTAGLVLADASDDSYGAVGKHAPRRG